MKRFGKKRDIRTLIFSKGMAVILAILCLFLAYSTYERYTVERLMLERRSGAEAEYKTLEVQRDALLERVEYLRDDSGRESEIRKHFDVAREGEQVVVIVDGPEEEVRLSEGTAPPVQSSAWWQFWR